MHATATGHPNSIVERQLLLSEETAAVLVVYSLATDPKPLLDQLSSLLAHVVVVDNSPGGHPSVQDWRADARLTVICNGNRGGLAGAYNSAVRWLQAHRSDIRFVTFVDEDSDAEVLEQFLCDPVVVAKLGDPLTAAIAPAHRERATGLRTRHLQLRRLGWSYLRREVRGLHKVAFLINSLSVWRMTTLEKLGAYNEWLGVDHIDTEYCLRARLAGYTVYMYGNLEFLHSIGQRRRYRLFRWELQTCGHGPERRRSIGRTTAWLAARHPWKEPAFSVLCLARLAYEIVGILLAESQRPGKLLAFGGGVIEGFLKGVLVRDGDCRK